jgi:microcompartment protein CcmL/EutN
VTSTIAVSSIIALSMLVVGGIVFIASRGELSAVQAAIFAGAATGMTNISIELARYFTNTKGDK